MKAYYAVVKRASQAEKQEMAETAASYNELAEHAGLEERYWVDRNALFVKSGDNVDSSAFVRCSKCGHVRELFEGQIEFCDSCGVDWDE